MKEREIREFKDIRVILNDGDQNFPGTIINFSKTGMSIKTTHAFPAYKAIDIGIKIGEKLISLKGSVRWVNETSCSTDQPSGKQFQIGVSIQNPSTEYLRYFES